MHKYHRQTKPPLPSMCFQSMHKLNIKCKQKNLAQNPASALSSNAHHNKDSHRRRNRQNSKSRHDAARSSTLRRRRRQRELWLVRRRLRVVHSTVPAVGAETLVADVGYGRPGTNEAALEDCTSDACWPLK